MKHTPGPWELDSAKDGDSRYQIINGQLPKGINGDFGYPVADTMNRHHCIAPEEDEANGQLLAAAPEMLEALEAIAKDCGIMATQCSKRNDTMCLNEFAEYQRIATEAIRKARGEQ